MSYGYFAEFYDSFTDDVNYDKIEKFVCSLLSREGINGGLLLDLRAARVLSRCASPKRGIP